MPFKVERRFGKRDALVIVLIILVGLLHLPFPFHGDQALFTVAAAKIRHGAVLYRDCWDLKQPGIFSFYLLAGTCFGFTEEGVHALELLWMATFAVVLITTLKSHFQHPALASLVPLLTIGFYYGVCGSWHLTQVEGLVGFPLYLALWFAAGASSCERPRFWGLFLSGLMGGVVLLFKLLFVLILVGFWLTTVLDAVVRQRVKPLTAIVQISVPALLGLLVPLLPVFLYFARLGLLNLLFKTYLEYPPRMVAELPNNGYSVLIDGLVWFASRFAPLLVLAFVGACLSLRRRTDLVTANVILWFVLGFAVILVQRRSWWAYHYLLLSVPLGILAVKGIDELWSRVRQLGPTMKSWKGRAVLSFGLILLFLPVLGSLAQKGLFLALHNFALTRSDRLAYQKRFNNDYRTALAEVAFLAEAESQLGPIYVCGNPIFYTLSGRDQAIALHGWSIESYLPEQWMQVREQLAEALPPYVFVEESYRDLIAERSPELARFLHENYREFRQSHAGVWYVKRE